MNPIRFNTMQRLPQVSRVRASTATTIALAAALAAVMAFQPITASATAVGIEHWAVTKSMSAQAEPREAWELN